MTEWLEDGVGAKGEDGDAGFQPGRLPRAPRPDLCRRFARRELAQGLPGILARFVNEAQKGSIPHAKALMSLAGLDKEEPLATAVTRKKPKGLSEMLLRELRRRPPAVAGPAETAQTKRSVDAREGGDEGSGGRGGSAEQRTDV